MNSGLIAYRKNDPLMKKWMVNSIMLKDVPEGEHHSDQAVLNYLMYHDNYDPTEIPLSYASFGHAIHTGQETLIHWCGYGQTAIRRALASLKDYDWNMHRYYDLSWLYGHPEQDEGVLAASDDKQEWMIPWFVGNCRRHSRLPIAVANLGLTQGAVDWCEKNGVKVITLADKFSKAKDTFGWFKKPLACIATPFKKTIFMDTDVEVRKPFDAISSSVFSERQVAMRHDVYTVNSKYTDALPTTDPKIWNSGVIVYHHGNEIIRQWAIKMMQLMSSKPWEYVDGFGGDQDLLSMLIIMHAKESLVELPVSQVRLRVEGDGDSILYHWTGPTGKEHIKNSLLHRLKQAQNIGQ
jgi:hypothetical protein